MALENRDRHKQIQRWWKDFYCRLVKIFVLILAVTFIINLIKKDGTFSEEENRVLAKRPEFTWDSVKSGKYMAEFETYISDQFFARNQWITLKLYEDRFLGKRESNGVYLGKKGYLMEAADNPDWGNVEKNMDSMASFAEKYPDVPVYLSLVPNASYILKDKLPY